MENICQHGWMPEEIHSEEEKMDDDGTLAKMLFYDIVQQSQVATGLSSVDKANYYDSIAHTIASLVFQSFGVPKEAVKSMLTAIEEMKYFLRIACGNSKNFAWSTTELKFQGSCQGNGAAPARRTVFSIVILDSHKRKEHRGNVVCSILRQSGHLAAIFLFGIWTYSHRSSREPDSK